MRDEIDRFRSRQVQPFGINPASAQSHADYARRLQLPFTLLSDPGLRVSRAYGAVRPDGSEIARSVVLVDRDGSVAYAQAGAPSADIILESLGDG